jgi:hypothetical protein
MRILAAQMDELERGIGSLNQEFAVYVSQRAPTTDTMQLQRDLHAFRERLGLLRNYVDAVGNMGGPSGLTRETAGQYRVLHFLAQQLRSRVVAYEDMLAQEREAQRLYKLWQADWERRQAEERRLLELRKVEERRLSKVREAERETEARHTAWHYLQALVGVACADPESVTKLASEGKLLAIKLSHTDFMHFFIADRSRSRVIAALAGEWPPPNKCQQTILSAMLKGRGPISLDELRRQAERYRVEHPGMLKQLGDSLEAFREFVREFFSELSSALDSLGTGSSGGGSQGGGSHRERPERSAGTTDYRVPNVDLSQPDWGPGSTLGR